MSARVTLATTPEGDLVIENEDGRITVRSDGTVEISTIAPIQLTGDSISKLDNVKFPGQEPINPYVVQRVIDYLMKRGKKA